MPVFDISDGAGGLRALSREKVLARMAYPDDEDSFFNYLSWMVINGLAAGKPEGSVSILKTTLANILAGPSFSERTEAVNRQFQKGYAAALLLEMILSTHHHHPEFKPSVSKAWDVVSKVYREAHGNDSRYPYSIAYLKEQWAHFKPVVHLWTAHLCFLRNDQALTMSADIWLPGPEHERRLLEFLAVAEALREQAQTIFPHGQKTPILAPGETWTIPVDIRLPGVEVKPAPLPEDMLAALRTRKAPRRL